MGAGKKIVPGTNLGRPRDSPAHLGLAGFAAWAPVAGPTALLRPSPPPGICRHIRHGATGRVMQDSNVAALRQLRQFLGVAGKMAANLPGGGRTRNLQHQFKIKPYVTCCDDSSLRVDCDAGFSLHAGSSVRSCCAWHAWLYARPRPEP